LSTPKQQIPPLQHQALSAALAELLEFVTPGTAGNPDKAIGIHEFKSDELRARIKANL